MRIPGVTRARVVMCVAGLTLVGCTSPSAPTLPSPSSTVPSPSSTVPSPSSTVPSPSSTTTRPTTAATAPKATQQQAQLTVPTRTSAVTAAAEGASRVGSQGAGAALAALAALPVKGRAPKTGYSRAMFGTAWTDDVSVDGGHNGCDTRNDVLRRDLRAVAIKAGTHGCVAVAGTLHDPYTGKIIPFVRGEKTSVLVQIDHVVAISDAWQTGAQALSELTRENMANDPLELLAVDGPTNESKGDGDAATWLPPNKAFRCAYVARQIAVKAKYLLWVTAAERAAMAGVLSSCPAQQLPTAAETNTPVLPTG